RKNGGFIPGIRPGAPTRDYLAKVVYRISLAGALFLGIVAVSPILLQIPFAGSVVANFSLGGTALLIVVSVVGETMKQLEAQLMVRNCEGFIRRPSPPRRSSPQQGRDRQPPIRRGTVAG